MNDPHIPITGIIKRLSVFTHPKESGVRAVLIDYEEIDDGRFCQIALAYDERILA